MAASLRPAPAMLAAVLLLAGTALAHVRVGGIDHAHHALPVSRRAATRMAPRGRPPSKPAVVVEPAPAVEVDEDDSLGWGDEQDEVEEYDSAITRIFVVFGRDHESLEDVRFANHLAHVQHLREGGYFLQPHLMAAAGTMYAVGAHNAQDAIAIAASDPLNQDYS
ncbi:hypothetical protein T492DRAFT_888108 [Pavlovales sp. CCMP2436]|nr:hypothetical protein T492DRAFT_888108 [Pavlovales sp. CCMP2436]